MQSVHDLQLMDWITQSYSFGPLMVQYKKIYDIDLSWSLKKLF